MEQGKALKVAIVGGGPGCKAIMTMIFREKLSELPMNLIGVACTNTDAVGYLYAKEKGLYTTTDYRDLYKLEDLDMIIELTGKDEVAAQISQSKPQNVRLMDHVTARLFWDLFQIEEERISERKKAQAALEAAEHEKGHILGALVEHVIHQDPDLKVLWANRAACESAGMSLAEIQGRYCYNIWAEREDACPDCPVAKAMETGQFQDVEKWTPGGRAWYIQGHPVRNEKGEVVGAVEVTLDVTERKRAEKALRESEARYRAVVQDQTELICRFTPDRRLSFVNDAYCRYLNKVPAELIGQTFMPAVHGEDREMVKNHLASINRENPVSTHEHRVISPDGEIRWQRWTNRAIFDKDGDIVEFQAVGRDITERKHTEAQLQQMQRLESIGTLAGGIAHDFNNILMGIQGNASMMLLDMNEDDHHYERLRNIEKQVRSGARLTSHLLAYARKGKYEVKPFSLNQLIEEACDTFGRARREVTIRRHLSENAHAVEGDPGQIEQVLLNLFVNAAEAMPDGGDFILETMNVTHHDMTGRLYKPKQGNYVLLKVTDSGAGMDQETVDRIFEPFFTMKEMGRGTGLGLASAYGIIKAHEGYIDVDSRRGHGTTFSIYLPASKKEALKTARATDTIVKRTETVLLADDEEVVRQAGKELLETMGYRVFICKDGEEAIDLYEKKRNEIDIVLLDIVMPNMGGREAYEALRTINPDIKVLLLSGYSIDGQATEILERGANAFIQKPFSMKKLSGKIREVLDDQ